MRAETGLFYEVHVNRVDFAEWARLTCGSDYEARASIVAGCPVLEADHLRAYVEPLDATQARVFVLMLTDATLGPALLELGAWSQVQPILSVAAGEYQARVPTAGEFDLTFRQALERAGATDVEMVTPAGDDSVVLGFTLPRLAILSRGLFTYTGAWEHQDEVESLSAWGWAAAFAGAVGLGSLVLFGGKAKR